MKWSWLDAQRGAWVWFSSSAKKVSRRYLGPWSNPSYNVRFLISWIWNIPIFKLVSTHWGPVTGLWRIVRMSTVGTNLICTVANCEMPHSQNRINNIYSIRIDYQSQTGLCSFQWVEPLFRPICDFNMLRIEYNVYVISSFDQGYHDHGTMDRTLN